MNSYFRGVMLLSGARGDRILKGVETWSEWVMGGEWEVNMDCTGAGSGEGVFLRREGCL